MAAAGETPSHLGDADDKRRPKARTRRCNLRFDLEAIPVDEECGKAVAFDISIAHGGCA